MSLENNKIINNVDSLIFKIEYRRLQQIIEYKKD